MRVSAATWDATDESAAHITRPTVENRPEAIRVLLGLIESKTSRWLAASFDELSLWICSVDQWWWVVQHTGDLDVFFNPEETRVGLSGHYEFVEAIWETFLLLPWWGASDAAWAMKTVKLIGASARPQSVRTYSQIPPVLLPRHRLEQGILQVFLELEQELPPLTG